MLPRGGEGQPSDKLRYNEVVKGLGSFTLLGDLHKGKSEESMD
jgi:hypothetical protein